MWVCCECVKVLYPFRGRTPCRWAGRWRATTATAALRCRPRRRADGRRRRRASAQAGSRPRPWPASAPEWGRRRFDWRARRPHSAAGRCSPGGRSRSRATGACASAAASAASPPQCGPPCWCAHASNVQEVSEIGFCFFIVITRKSQKL